MNSIRLYVDAPNEPPGAVIPVEVVVMSTRRTVRALAQTGRGATPIDVEPEHGPVYIEATLTDGQVLTAYVDAGMAETVTLRPVIVEKKGGDGVAVPASHSATPEESAVDPYRGGWARLWISEQRAWTPVSFTPDYIRIQEAGVRWGMTGVGGCSLQVGGEFVSQRCVVLPPAHRVTVTLTHTGLDTQGFGDGYTLTARSDDVHAEALLAYCAAGQLTAAKTIANSYEELAELMLYSKVANPLGAIIGGYYLLRTRAVERMYNWPRNLADLFNRWPDATVVRIGQLLLSPEPDRKELRGRALHAVHAGLPSYTDGLRWLYRAVELLLAVDPEDQQLRTAHAWLRPYADAVDWNAVLTTFRGGPDHPIVERRMGPPAGPGGDLVLLVPG